MLHFQLNCLLCCETIPCPSHPMSSMYPNLHYYSAIGKSPAFVLKKSWLLCICVGLGQTEEASCRRQDRGEQDLKGSRNLKQEKHRPPNLQQCGKGRGCWFHAWNGDDSNFHVKGRKPHKAGERGWGQASVNLHSTLSMFYGLCVKLGYLRFLRRCVFPEINLFLRFLISINLYL